jgi:hypothetical protein
MVRVDLYYGACDSTASKSDNILTYLVLRKVARSSLQDITGGPGLLKRHWYSLFLRAHTWCNGLDFVGAGRRWQLAWERLLGLAVTFFDFDHPTARRAAVIRGDLHH